MFFSDAVIAIALTLLILPLMESVYEIDGGSTAAWVLAEAGPLINFLVSFAVIATMWSFHHGSFARVRAVTRPLLLLDLGWLATIVFLPVATALTNATEPDVLQHLFYIGTMLLSSVLLVAINTVITRDRRVTDVPGGNLGHLAAALAMAACLSAALLVACLTPLNDAAMTLMLLVAPLQRMISRPLRRRGLPGPDPAGRESDT
ncbi:MAG TPA: TMEM175 family protein [Bacillota bacterium]|nr:TMEM175 family protein [Bacillota bacterium]